MTRQDEKSKTNLTHTGLLMEGLEPQVSRNVHFMREDLNVANTCGSAQATAAPAHSPLSFNLRRRNPENPKCVEDEVLFFY